MYKDDFEIIHEKDKEWGDYLICKHCGQRVERGVFNVSDHWLNCLERKDGFIYARNEAEKKALDKLSMNV